MESFTFEVTQEDIDKGTPSANERCAVARALNRAVGEGRFVSVGGSIGFIYNKLELKNHIMVSTKSHQIILSEAVMDFIYNFDENNKVEPTTFTVLLEKL